MGSVYRRSTVICTTCNRRLFKTAERKACRAQHHQLRKRKSPVWWISYKTKHGWHDESSRSQDKIDAQRLLRDREGAVDRGHTGGPYAFKDAAAAVIADYQRNKRRSLNKVELRIRKHLAPFFDGLVMADITTAKILDYIAKRQADTWIVRQARTIEHDDARVTEVPEVRRGVSNGEINRELGVLKRAFSLAIQSQRIFFAPHIPMLKEAHPRTGFFTPDDFEALRAQLPTHLQGIWSFLYLTGWRIDTEVLALEWRRVDFDAEQITLDPGTTKSGEPRTFPFTSVLRTALKAQRKLTQHLESPLVFCHVDGWRAGRRISYGGWLKAFRKARAAAGIDASRIPHDARRTVVQTLDRAGVGRWR